MYDGEVALAIYRPRDPAAMREEACVQPARSGGAVKVAVIADNDVAQRNHSVLIVPVRIQGAEGVQHLELAGCGNTEDRAVAIRAAGLGHAIKHTVGAGRQSIARICAVGIVSIRIQCAEGMQDCVSMRLPVEAVDDAIAKLAAEIGHTINGALSNADDQADDVEEVMGKALAVELDKLIYEVRELAAR